MCDNLSKKFKEQGFAVEPIVLEKIVNKDCFLKKYYNKKLESCDVLILDLILETKFEPKWQMGEFICNWLPASHPPVIAYTGQDVYLKDSTQASEVIKKGVGDFLFKKADDDYLSKKLGEMFNNQKAVIGIGSNSEEGIQIIKKVIREICFPNEKWGDPSLPGWRFKFKKDVNFHYHLFPQKSHGEICEVEKDTESLIEETDLFIFYYKTYLPKEQENSDNFIKEKIEKLNQISTVENLKTYILDIDKILSQQESKFSKEEPKKALQLIREVALTRFLFRNPSFRQRLLQYLVDKEILFIFDGTVDTSLLNFLMNHFGINTCFQVALPQNSENKSPGYDNFSATVKSILEKLCKLNTFEKIIGIQISDSLELKKVYGKLNDFAKGDAPLLIMGETGTGKEYIAKAFARMWYMESPELRGSQYEVLHCFEAMNPSDYEAKLKGIGPYTGGPKIPPGKKYIPGLIELAKNGCLLIDEIDHIPKEYCAELHRVIEGYPFKPVFISDINVKPRCRWIATTAITDMRKLEERLNPELLGRFRNTILIKPLRERGDDIILYADKFLRKWARRYGKAFITGFDENAKSLLKNYNWQYNLRELDAVVENIVIKTVGTELVNESIVSELLPRKDKLPEAIELLFQPVEDILSQCCQGHRHGPQIIKGGRLVLREHIFSLFAADKRKSENTHWQSIRRAITGQNFKKKKGSDFNLNMLKKIKYSVVNSKIILPEEIFEKKEVSFKDKCMPNLLKEVKDAYLCKIKDIFSKCELTLFHDSSNNEIVIQKVNNSTKELDIKSINDTNYLKFAWFVYLYKLFITIKEIKEKETLTY